MGVARRVLRSVNPVAAAPSAPTGLVAVAGNARVPLTWTAPAIADGHGTLSVTLTVVKSVITVARGTLVTNDGSETEQINATALPKCNSDVVVARSGDIARVSGAALTFAAYKTSLQSALTRAGR